GGATVAGGGRPSGQRPSGPRPVGPVVAGGLAPDPMARARIPGGNGASGGAGEAKPGFTPSGARIGRNDICWCGSGLKYKKCHGR
ncbi:MAG TPA: SEC-C metal-binding domain-containing protein, partial [Candidatus Limnocylindrales bacterium]